MDTDEAKQAAALDAYLNLPQQSAAPPAPPPAPQPAVFRRVPPVAPAPQQAASPAKCVKLEEEDAAAPPVDAPAGADTAGKASTVFRRVPPTVPAPQQPAPRPSKRVKVEHDAAPPVAGAETTGEGKRMAYLLLIGDSSALSGASRPALDEAEAALRAALATVQRQRDKAARPRLNVHTSH